MLKIKIHALLQPTGSSFFTYQLIVYYTVYGSQQKPISIIAAAGSLKLAGIASIIKCIL
jgi:hypothetical protein